MMDLTDREGHLFRKLQTLANLEKVERQLVGEACKTVQDFVASFKSPKEAQNFALDADLLAIMDKEDPEENEETKVQRLEDWAQFEIRLQETFI